MPELAEIPAAFFDMRRKFHDWLARRDWTMAVSAELLPKFFQYKTTD